MLSGTQKRYSQSLQISWKGQFPIGLHQLETDNTLLQSPPHLCFQSCISMVLNSRFLRMD